MTAEWTFAHTAPAILLIAALFLGAAWTVYSFLRHLPRTPRGGAILALRLLFLLLLAWTLFLPGRRRVTVETVRPRFFVLLDTSASMTQNHEADPASDASRWRKARDFLARDWVGTLRSRCQIEVYPFAADLGTPVSPEETEGLVPNGGSTLLNANIGRLFERARGQEIAGVLLLSDGIDTRERGGAWAEAPWPAPIFVAALETPEETEPLPDVRVEAVITPRRAIVDWDTTLTATIAGNGIRGESFSVRLQRNGEIVEEAAVQLPPEGGARDLQFTLAHPAIGTELWTVSIPPLPREPQTNDNELAVAVDVLDARNRVLFLEHTPRFESKQVVRELFANRDITPLAYFRGPGGAFIAYGNQPGRLLEISIEQLRENKIIILGDFDAEALDAEKCRVIAEFVEKGGSLILLGGSRLWGAHGISATPLAGLLPFTRAPGAAREGRFAVRWTAEGRAHPAFVNNPDVPVELPPVLSVFGGAVPTAAALTLVEAETEAGMEPLLLSRAYGQGKVLAILTDSLWRWAMQPRADKPYAMFWRQMIEWMSPAAGETGDYAIELFTDTATIAVGEPAMLQARLIEPAGALPRAWKIGCELLAPSGRTITLAMAGRLIPGAGGREIQGFAAEFTPTEAGNWKAVASVEVDGRTVASSPCFFSVRAVSRETVEQPAAVGALRALARSSGGRYAAPDAVDEMLRNLQVSIKQERRMDEASLWQNRWLLACLIALLALEWMLRKAGGMN